MVLGTFALAIWSPPHVDNPNELHTALVVLMEILTGAAKGNFQVFGQDPLMAHG